ncbi:LPXTG-motif cell wall anchor domain protein [Coriobacterium glomerans PW2]|uniref:LPXTG-motif cell wall anchor domain protein n=1 Tax=Coriobacterium glomerans (strain ATCC 49209 / DSM 20642 / JCM 10262 / PW2) TaxID=700015 RepID=F2N7B1_CORGP|nr:SpaH/EbpB family LPXTG-anchored major pilin [Coriobacterium glomerans]AEB06586.1 LPXTG-motif cell wall anchor domain protein [Coriobacterium glomerans PW2]
MRHNSKTWLGVFLALFFAVAMVVLQTPGTASALEDGPDDAADTPDWDPTVDNGIATFTNLNPGDKVTMYQIGRTKLDTSNRLYTRWVDPDDKDQETPEGSTIYGCEVQTWIDAASNEDTSVLEELSNVISGKANDFLGKLPNFSSTGVVADGVLTVENLPAGLYYTVIDNSDNATYVYQNLITAVIPQPDNKGHWHQPKGGSGPKRTQMDKAINQFVSDKAAGPFDQNVVDTVGRDQTAYFQTTAMIPRYVGTDKDLNSRTLSFTIQYPNDTKETPGKIEIQDNSFAIKSNGEDVKDLLKIQDNKEANPGVITISPDEGKMAEFLKKAQGKPIAITYQGMVGEKVAPGTKMVVPISQTFSKNSYGIDPEKDIMTIDSTGTGKDKKPIQAEINEYGLKVKKVSVKDPSALLEGAVFDLYRAKSDGTKEDNPVTTVTTTTEHGYSATIPALGLGTYYLVETKTPAGFIAPTDDTKVTLTTEGMDNSVLTQTIANTPNNTPDQKILPTTGGPGTIALTVIGVGLMVAALVWIVRSRRHE